MPVIFAEGPCNTRCHAGNDDVDVIGIVRIILRDGREDVRSGGIQLHQVAWDRRILRVLSVQSFLDLFEGCVDTLLRGVDHVLDIEDILSGLFEPLHLRCVN